CKIDECLQKKLPLHNQFVLNQLHNFSKATLEKNKAALKEFGMPSWSDEAWESFKNKPSPVSSNVIVTTNDFLNKPHHYKDQNLFMYGVFSYIDRSTGKTSSIASPAQTCKSQQQGPPSYPPQIFEDTQYDFLNVTVILGRPLESLNNDISHHTIGPPDALKTTKASTHIGFPFQISHHLVSRALKLNKLSKAEKEEENDQPSRKI
ncbi:hypothetical protein MJO28_002878, partial [Puccinia striiformis f. sp. tritici]